MSLAKFNKDRSLIDTFVMMPYGIISMFVSAVRATIACVSTDPAWGQISQFLAPFMVAHPDLMAPMVAMPTLFDWIDTVFVVGDVFETSMDLYDMFVNQVSYDWFFFGRQVIFTIFDAAQQTGIMVHGFMA